MGVSGRKVACECKLFATKIRCCFHKTCRGPVGFFTRSTKFRVGTRRRQEKSWHRVQWRSIWHLVSVSHVPTTGLQSPKQTRDISTNRQVRSNFRCWKAFSAIYLRSFAHKQSSWMVTSFSKTTHNNFIGEQYTSLTHRKKAAQKQLKTLMPRNSWIVSL